MDLHTVLDGDLTTSASSASELERLGYDTLLVRETSNDPFLALLLAAQSTERVRLGTAVALALTRNPMNVAITADHLQRYSGGRLVLGLGSQVRAHVTRRFGMPWSQPVDRMQEFVHALHAIWDCWDTGGELRFEGRFHTHTLMPAPLRPPPNPFGRPKVFLAGVGTAMTRAAGAVADGFMSHPFTTDRYLREVTLPALRDGATSAGRSPDALELFASALVVTGHDERAMLERAESVRTQVAIYGSTPAYRSVLELHGWGDLQLELHQLARAGRWAEMGQLVDDDALATFAVVAEPHQLAEALRVRFADIATGVDVYETDLNAARAVAASMRPTVAAR